MKNIKMTLLAVALMVATAASAQFSLGVKSGVNLSNVMVDGGSSPSAKVGFNVGLMADYDFARNMAIQSGLFFTTKGFKLEDTTEGKTAKFTSNLMYLQVPVHFAYKVDVTPGTRIVFNGGPYTAYGIGGKHSISGSGVTLSGDDKIFGSGEGQFKPFDAGIGIGIGAEFGRILAGIGWDMGLINISNISGESVKNQNAYVTVGYRF